MECMSRTFEKKLRKVEKKITLWGSPEKALCLQCFMAFLQGIKLRKFPKLALILYTAVKTFLKNY